jgi:hypothetical protein
MQKSHIQDHDFFVPLDCPICKLMMRDMNDSVQYLETKCCIQCWISLVEPLRKLHMNEDYCATEKDISGYREKLAELKIIK